MTVNKRSGGPAAKPEVREACVEAESPRDSKRYESFLERLSAKSRAAMVKHDESCDQASDLPRAELWRRLAAKLGSLAPFAAETFGSKALRFYIQDGKYRQQVFALEDTPAGVALFLPDVLAVALRRKVIEPDQGENKYRAAGESRWPVQIDLITADTPDLTTCKPMLGWGRKALRVNMTQSAHHVRTVEKLCEIAAEAWAGAAAAPGDSAAMATSKPRQ